jgi:TPR repeat protein
MQNPVKRWILQELHFLGVNKMRILLAGLLALLSMSLSAGPLQDANAATDRGDYKSAMELLIPLAESGNADALGNLGNAYAFGRGVDKDLVKAYGYWSRAADKHLGQAMFNIAVLYWTGQGSFTKDEAKAAAWYKKAAEHRHDQAMFTLSSIYATGRGLEKNMQLAAAWASLAASNARTEQLKNASLAQFREIVHGMDKEEMAKIQNIVNDLAKLIDANIKLYRGQ